MTGAVPGAQPRRKPTDEWAFLLPPGWARFPAGAEHAGAEHAGPEHAGAAGTAPGVVYLPTEPVAGMAVPASITETEILGDRRADPAVVAADVLGTGYTVSGPVDLDGRPGARLTNTVHDVHREGDRPTVSTRQVAYVVLRDEADGDWLVLTFSTSWSSRGTERLAETLVEFFDAVMATFRWRGPGADPVHLPERRVPGSV